MVKWGLDVLTTGSSCSNGWDMLLASGQMGHGMLLTRGETGGYDPETTAGTMWYTPALSKQVRQLGYRSTNYHSISLSKISDIHLSISDIQSCMHPSSTGAVQAGETTRIYLPFNYRSIIHPSIHPFFHPSIHPFFHPSIYRLSDKYRYRHR
jgi:hypothetical protein